MRVFILLFLWSSVTLAGVPQLIHPESGKSILWENPTAIPYWIDQGGLGKLSHTQARELVEAMMGVWEEIPTSAAQFQYQGALDRDVTAQNVADYVNLSICADDQPPSTPSMVRGESPIIFDSTGEIMEALAGPGSSGKIVGKSALRCFKGTRDNPVAATQAFIILNGKFIDGENDVVDLPINVFAGVVLHELGHFLGLHHSMVNESLYYEISKGERSPEDSRFLPVMFPLVLKNSQGATVLKPDDVAILSALYPTTYFSGEMGEIRGNVTDAAGEGVRGANVVARGSVDRWCHAVSAISGRHCTPLLDPLGTLNFMAEGCPNPDQLGAFQIVGLPADAYTVEVSEITAAGNARSNMFPRTEGIDLPGNAEFYNYNDKGSESPLISSEIMVTAGDAAERVDVVLDNTQPTALQTDAINLALFTPAIASACHSDPVDYQQLMDLVGVSASETGDPSLGSGPAGGCQLRLHR